MASVDAELLLFVREALAGGATRDEIETALKGAGWPEAQVRSALSRYADVKFAVPVPRPRAYLSARDAFVYLVLFSMLGLSAYFLGSLIFQLIDAAFPDPVARRSVGFWGHETRWAISVLVVAFPLFLFVSAKVAAEVEAEPSKRASKVRKWLTYMALFLASLIIAGDVVALVFQFLNGALTTPLVFKVVTVAVIAGGIFFYYLRSASDDDAQA